ncbi:hypothetical protein EVAR_75730_1 [Eumeta japonica]|uniref:Uncharacterized protein n=1 Tax=Eumeta variegata TaxID=151549 RepID=A0A4C2A213_EUMVA|nr:hypothetical protein EVAR_75730_1 [Eumeta japonica]
MDIRDPRRVTSMSPTSWKRIEYLVEGKWADGEGGRSGPPELSLTVRKATAFGMSPVAPVGRANGRELGLVNIIDFFGSTHASAGALGRAVHVK